MQHYICRDTSLWDEWAHERFQNACAELARAFAESTERGKALETQLGIYYNGGVGVAFRGQRSCVQSPRDGVSGCAALHLGVG